MKNRKAHQKVFAALVAFSFPSAAVAQAWGGSAEERLAILAATAAYVEEKCPALRINRVVHAAAVNGTGADVRSPLVGLYGRKWIGTLIQGGPQASCVAIISLFGPRGQAVPNAVRER